MKKWFTVVVSSIAVILLSYGMIALHGHNQRNYSNYIHLGQNEVIDSHYLGAMNYFQGAYRVNSNRSEAKKDLIQTQSYVSGLHYFKKKQFKCSIKAYRQSMKVNRISALNRRSRLGYNCVKTLMTSLKWFTKLYNQALILNHDRKYKASNVNIHKILDDSQISQSYFKRFKLNVKKLMVANDKKRWSDVNSGLDINRGQLSRFRLRVPQVITEKPSKVTIKNARQAIHRAGVDVQKMSNHDVANLIRQARKHGSSIYSYAKQNY